eukprot:scaffold716_cov364-Pinguiococcus_pyrenoidosus.AAC.4
MHDDVHGHGCLQRSRRPHQQRNLQSRGADSVVPLEVHGLVGRVQRRFHRLVVAEVEEHLGARLLPKAPDAQRLRQHALDDHSRLGPEAPHALLAVGASDDARIHGFLGLPCQVLLVGVGIAAGQVVQSLPKRLRLGAHGAHVEAQLLGEAADLRIQRGLRHGRVGVPSSAASAWGHAPPRWSSSSQRCKDVGKRASDALAEGERGGGGREALRQKKGGMKWGKPETAGI